MGNDAQFAQRHGRKGCVVLTQGHHRAIRGLFHDGGQDRRGRVSQAWHRQPAKGQSACHGGEPTRREPRQGQKIPQVLPYKDEVDTRFKIRVFPGSGGFLH